MSRTRRWILPAVASLAAGCAANPAPKDWLPKPVEATHLARGGWIAIRDPMAAKVPSFEGELIAVDENAFHVLTAKGFVSVPRASVHTATLAGYKTGASALAAWTGAGAATTPSHGAYLVFTLPLWLISGGLAAGSESRVSLVEFPKQPMAAFALYARFPQGLPPDLDPSSLGRLDTAPRPTPEPTAKPR